MNTLSYHSSYYNVLHNTVQQLNSDLSAELKVGHHYGNLRAGDDEDDKDEEEEAKEVVELVFPDGRQDEGTAQQTQLQTGGCLLSLTCGCRREREREVAPLTYVYNSRCVLCHPTGYTLV